MDSQNFGSEEFNQPVESPQVMFAQPKYQYVSAEENEEYRDETRPFGRAAMESDELEDKKQEQRLPAGTDLTWSNLLENQCPYLYAMIQKEDGEIDAAALDSIMRKLQLNPCDPNGRDTQECLQRNCATLWRHYIQRKHNKNKNWKRCGSSLVDPKHFNSECVEAQTIADHMFNERDSFSYRPGDIAFLYDLTKLESADNGKFGSVHKISKKRGDAILKINYKVNAGSIHGNNIMRYLLVNHPILLDHFINVYNMEVGSVSTQPNRKFTEATNMYLLLESMDGSFNNFQKYFQVRDPHYWNRLNRMLCHALLGLYRLNYLGFSHNDVKKENLLYKLDFENTLVATKWCDYDCIGPLGHRPICMTDRSFDPLLYNAAQRREPHTDYSSTDRFAFGIMVYELLFGEHISGKSVDKTWSGLYVQAKNPASMRMHESIRKLLDKNNALQPIATVAYHFIVNDQLFPNEKRWNYDTAFEFIRKADLSRDVLPPLPRPNDIPSLPHPTLNW